VPNYFKIEKLEGHIGRIEAKERYTDFSVVFNQKPKEGQPEKATVWFSCRAVGKAHDAVRHLSKGAAVSITNMIPEAWKDKQGAERWSWVVFAAEPWQRQEDGGGGGGGYHEPTFNPDDDIPFNLPPHLMA